METATNYPKPATNPQIFKNRKDFKELASPIIDFINERYGPHASVIITGSDAELLECAIGFTNRPVSEPKAEKTPETIQQEAHGLVHEVAFNIREGNTELAQQQLKRVDELLHIMCEPGVISM